jgi:NAD-dependent histone deacetylase SIR2
MGDFDFDSLSDVSDLSSAPSSPRLESSPEPAERYPTPSSQEGAEPAEGSARQGRPAKRRRNPLPKERTTQYLDLSKSLYEQNDQHYLLVQTLRHQKDIVVIAGAGISTAAGSKFLLLDSAASSHSLTYSHSSGLPLHRWFIQIIAKET